MAAPMLIHEHRPTLVDVVERMRSSNGEASLYGMTPGGYVKQFSYIEVAGRVDRLCAALDQLGIRVGAGVATLAWNTVEHFEIAMAAPAMGAVFHSLNLRIQPALLAALINEAQDEILFVDADQLPLYMKVAHALTSVRTVVTVGAVEVELHTAPHRVLDYDALLRDAGTGFVYPMLDERLVAGLCHTSGTTGRPKGVLYSHRAQFAHSLAAGMVDTFGVGRRDRVLAAVPMFHSVSWGLPYAAALHGADLLLPGVHPTPDRLGSLISDAGATLMAAVPTVWTDLLALADAGHANLATLRLGVTGGIAAAGDLVDGLKERHGVRLVQAWGMTEIRVGAIPSSPLSEQNESPSAQARIVAGVEARVVDGAGTVLPNDGMAVGELQVRGPWISQRYFGPASDDFASGWLRTGDLASLDGTGSMEIRDRLKDVIKSGGEWISSLELEQALLSHPKVAEAAVVAQPDARYTERPLAFIVRAPGGGVDSDALRAHLQDRVVRWWIPDRFIFTEALPRTGGGKVDKGLLRQRGRA